MSVWIADWISYTILGVLSNDYCHPSLFAVLQFRDVATRIRSNHSGPPVGRTGIRAILRDVQGVEG